MLNRLRLTGRKRKRNPFNFPDLHIQHATLYHMSPNLAYGHQFFHDKLRLAPEEHAVVSTFNYDCNFFKPTPYTGCAVEIRTNYHGNFQRASLVIGQLSAVRIVSFW